MAIFGGIDDNLLLDSWRVAWSLVLAAGDASAREGWRDRAIPPEPRRLIVAAIPRRVTRMDTDHSPFFSDPRSLASNCLRYRRKQHREDS